MKKSAVYSILFLIGVLFLFSGYGCGKKGKDQNELAVGNWTQTRNRAYILLVVNPKGEWNSSVKIADVTSKIVNSKGTAKGTWYIEKSQLILTVTQSDVEKVWEPVSTSFFNIMELSDTIMQLKDESGRTIVWKKTNRQKTDQVEADTIPVIPFGPIAVNLNKIRSNDKDRYLCLDMDLKLKELMPDQKIPAIHPRAREAAVIFLSSLVFNDVKDFDGVKNQSRKLVDVLNPYMEGFIKQIVINHVIIAKEINKVEEFMIEHTLTSEPAASEKGADSEETSKTAKKAKKD